jgi:hypothetical protein
MHAFSGSFAVPAATVASGFGGNTFNFGNTGTSLFGGNKLGAGTTAGFGGFGMTPGMSYRCCEREGNDVRNVM